MKEVTVAMPIAAKRKSDEGELEVSTSPENFLGLCYHFSYPESG